MQALPVTLCIVMIVNILQPHLMLCKPAAAGVLPEAATPQDVEDAANATFSPNIKPCYEEKSEEELFKQRINVLRGEILSKLRFEQPPENLSNGLVLMEEDNASFSAVLALNEAILKEQREQYMTDGCKERETFYAKEVKLYFPSHFQGELPSVNIFNWDFILPAKRHRRDKDDKDFKEDDKNDELKTNPDIKPETMTTTTTSYEPINHTPSPPSNPELKRLTALLTPIKYTLNFSEIHLPANTPVWSASLQLFKQKIISDDNSLKRTPNPTVNVEIFWVSTFIDNNDNHIRYPMLIKSQNVRTENDQYVSFDVTEAVKRWREEERSSQLQLEVRIRCPEDANTGLLFLPNVQFDVPNSRNKGSNNANLVIKVLTDSNDEKNNSTRTKRQNIATKKEYCLANPNEETCCLKESTINFHEDLGFDWIIAPTTFQLTYCKGLCPRVLSHGTSNLEFRGQLRTSNPTSSPEPCCVPHDTRPLTLLTRHETELVLLKLPGMIVDSCQCR